MIAARLDGAEDEVESLVWITLVQASLEIRRLIVIEEIHCTPFNVKDAIGRRARHRSKDAAAAGEVRTAFADYISAVISPKRENGEVIRAYIGRSGQAS